MDNRQQANHSNQPHTAHETHDIPVKPIVWTLAGLGVFLAIVMVVFAIWFRAEEAKRVAIEGASTQQMTELPENTPRLQSQPAADLQTMRAHEREMLTTYGWVDKDAGIGRIPIDRAMDLALEQGYPVREGQ
ncbi:MAG TPA: hypothetical protein ENJ48_03230 [Anaerolineae bacterium]|nr:hypothetical protein [Anaerolineae bacterium]